MSETVFVGIDDGGIARVDAGRVCGETVIAMSRVHESGIEEDVPEAVAGVAFDVFTGKNPRTFRGVRERCRGDNTVISDVRGAFDADCAVGDDVVPDDRFGCVIEI